MNDHPRGDRFRDEAQAEILHSHALGIAYSPIGQTDTGRKMAARLMEMPRLEGCPGCQEIHDAWAIARRWHRNAAEENAHATGWCRWAWIWGTMAMIELAMIVIALAAWGWLR